MPTSKILYQFPTRTFIENLLVRPNGHLLLTTFREGSVYGLDPNAPSPEPYLVAQLPNASSLTGIVQLEEEDVYAVTGGEQPKPMRFEGGSMKCFIVDLRNGIENVKTELAMEIPETEMMNGMANLPSNRHISLSLDSLEGRILRLDLKKKTWDVVFQHEMLKPRSDGKKVPLGANGAKIHDGWFYFTNSAQELFCRIKLSSDNSGDMAGEPELLTHNEGAEIDMSYDDFDIHAEQTVAYVGKHPDAVYKISLADGKQELFAGGPGQEIIESPTCTALSKDGKKLYIGAAGKVGEFLGKVVEIDVS